MSAANFIAAPSPNFNDRKGPVRYIVLHYTGMETGAAALQRMRDAEAQVAAHYMVEENGDVYALVDEDKRAWHAGVSSWRGETDINSASIGIEIVNGGHDFGLPEFPDVQIAAVISLVQDVMRRHLLAPRDVIGHSDIAPGRKEDPGEKFPWRDLADAGCAIWPDLQYRDDNDIDGQLRRIGYNLDAGRAAVLRAFQQRFRPQNCDGVCDDETTKLVGALAALS
jgi:N-acetylmuramoyl-L-alanine amidase